MILLCGIPSEGPMRRVANALDALGGPYVFLNQRRLDDVDLWYRIVQGELRGELRLGTVTYPLEGFRAVYWRLADVGQLPELRGMSHAAPRVRHARSLHDTLLRWIEIAPGRVVNRSGPMASNASKAWQMQRITRCGFKVPETLITNDPALVRDFCDRHGEVIFKSVSGNRSVVRTLGPEELGQLDRIRGCPTQFQAFVPGDNVRVHVIGSRALATHIDTAAVDYRYASRDGIDARLTPCELPEELVARCVALAADLELPFAGVDLKLTPEGEVFCFEVNPCPAFSYYEDHTEQAIAETLGRYLMEG